MLRKGRTREQASAQFAGEWDEGGAGNAFSTANRRFAPLKMPFLPYSGGPTQSGGLKGRGQCEALHSPETPGTLSAWPVRRRMSPKMIKDERAAALSNSPGDFFESLAPSHWEGVSCPIALPAMTKRKLARCWNITRLRAAALKS